MPRPLLPERSSWPTYSKPPDASAGSPPGCRSGAADPEPTADPEPAPDRLGVGGFVEPDAVVSDTVEVVVAEAVVGLAEGVGFVCGVVERVVVRGVVALLGPVGLPGVVLFFQFAEALSVVVHIVSVVRRFGLGRGVARVVVVQFLEVVVEVVEPVVVEVLVEVVEAAVVEVVELVVVLELVRLRVFLLVEEVVVEEAVRVGVSNVLVEVLLFAAVLVVEDAERPLAAAGDAVDAAGVVDEGVDAAGDHLVDVEEFTDVFLDVLHALGDLFVLVADGVDCRGEAPDLVFEFVQSVFEFVDVPATAAAVVHVAELVVAEATEVVATVVEAAQPAEVVAAVVTVLGHQPAAAEVVVVAGVRVVVLIPDDTLQHVPDAHADESAREKHEQPHCIRHFRHDGLQGLGERGTTHWLKSRYLHS